MSYLTSYLGYDKSVSDQHLLKANLPFQLESEIQPCEGVEIDTGRKQTIESEEVIVKDNQKRILKK